MVGKFLKKLRLQKQLTLGQPDAKLMYGVGNLSNYENGKINPRNETILWILCEGLNIDKKQALNLVYEWRKKELKNKLFGDMD